MREDHKITPGILGFTRSAVLWNWARQRRNLNCLKLPVFVWPLVVSKVESFILMSISITVLIQPAAEEGKGLKISYLAGDFFEKMLRSYNLISAGEIRACVSMVEES